MKKALFLCLVCTLFGGIAFAQQVVVAVAPFEVRSDISAADANTITEIYSIRLAAARTVRVVTREALDRVAREHSFQAGDWSDDSKTAALGKALNADWIVRGTLQKLGSRFIITVSLLDIKSLEVMGGADMRLDSIDDAYDAMGDFVARTVQTISGGGSTGIQIPASRPSQPAAPQESQPPEGFVFVQGGTFQMGTASGGENDERPVHSVTVKSFYMGKYEVTQKEWMEIMGTTIRQQRDARDRSLSLYGEGDNYPMYYVSWHEVIEYCNKRSLREGLTPAYRGSGNSVTCDFSASGYRLPTEAEWEYAAKGGDKTYLTTEYSGSNNVESVGWYTGNSGSQTHPVGTKQPNDLGIYDMSGNVWEWCWDWYGAYTGGSQTDPAGAASGSFRVLRGGGWSRSAGNLRSAYRGNDTPANRHVNSGFRLVRP